MGSFYKEYSTKQAFDAAFDVETSVDDISHFINRYLADSALARDLLTRVAAQPYGPTQREHLDLFPPDGASAAAPLLVFLHGGSWHMHAAEDFSFVALGPVAAGMGVAVVTYDLCPDVGIAEIVRQARSAIAWLARNAASFGCNGRQITVIGHSAGGHLAAMTGLTDWSRYGLPDDTVGICVPISAVFDLEPMALCDLQAHVRLTDTDIRWQSPLHLIRKVPVRCLTVWGERDTAGFVEQSQAFASAWASAGNSGQTLVVPGANHFEVIDGLKQADSQLMRAVLALQSKFLSIS